MHRRTPIRSLAALILGALVLGAVAPDPALADPIADKQAQAAEVAGRLNELEERMFELDNDYRNAQAALDETNGRIGESQAQVDATSADLEAQRAQLRDIAIDAYVQGGDSGELDTLLRSEGDDAPQRSSYMQVATGSRRDVLDQLEATRQKLDEQIAQLEAAKTEAEQHAAAMEQARDAGEAALAEEQEIKARIDGELAALVAEEQARQQRELEARLRAEAEQRAAQEAAAQQAAAQQAAAQQQRAQASAPTSAAGQAAPAPAPSSTARQGGTSTPAPAPAPAPGPTPTTPAPAPTPTPTTPTAPPPSGGAGAAVAAAMSMVGVPYRWGGADPTGFDCSGLTSWAWAKGGKSLPRTTGGQWSAGTKVPMNALQPGDLIFYNGLGHVGMYVGGGSMVHAPRTGQNVRVNSVYYWGPIDGAVRP